MKKTYKIDVDCANCANKMEEAAKKTAGVKDATVNFMMLKMIVEFEEGQDPKAVMLEVRKNCKKVEDDCEIFLGLGNDPADECLPDAVGILVPDRYLIRRNEPGTNRKSR